MKIVQTFKKHNFEARCFKEDVLSTIEKCVKNFSKLVNVKIIRNVNFFIKIVNSSKRKEFVNIPTDALFITEKNKKLINLQIRNLK